MFKTQGCDDMDENNKENLTNNKDSDLFENFKRENGNIDNLLEDAFAFMNEDYADEPAEEETYQDEDYSTENVKQSKKAEKAAKKADRYEGMTEEEVNSEKMKKKL